METEELKQSLLNTEYPKLLHASEDLIFKDPINKRTDFSNFFNKHFNKKINRVLVDNLKDNNNAIYLIGGSRSWDNLINNNYGSLKNKLDLSNLEKTSIIPGNYDVFCIANKSDKVNTIINKMCKVFDDIITICQEENEEITFIRNYEKVDENGKFNPIILFLKSGKNKGNIKCLSNNYYSEAGCVFAPCKAMHLEISGGDFNEKVIIYFELLLIKNPNIIHYIRDNIVDNNPNNTLNYLNLKGLYLFSELIISRRRDKDFDVDTYRKNLLNKLIETDPNFNKIGMYYKIIQIYSYMFRDRTNFNLMRIILTKNFVFLSDKHVIDDYSSYLTEHFRIYINSFILNTNTDLSKAIYPRYKFFVTGGDAYRRYIPEIITQTNDIDLKLIYTNKEDHTLILNTVVENMSNLIYILYSHKPINNIQTYTINDYISVEFIPKYPGGQFRLRYVESENFTLLSIDYRYRLKININNNSIIVNEEFALLDVVLAHNEALPTIRADGFIPVASPDYLINDLHKIYDKINKDLHSRFHKNSKDKQRFKNLIEYVKKYSYDITTTSNLKRNRYEPEDDVIERNSIRKLRIKETNANEKYINNVKKMLEENEEDDETDNIEIQGENLNRFINQYVYENFNNKDISLEYSNIFIEKINENNKLDEEDKVYKIKMSFDDIKIIAAKYITDYSEELDDISDLLSNVALTEPDVSSNKSSPKNKKNIDENIDENIDDIDKMFDNLNL